MPRLEGEPSAGVTKALRVGGTAMTVGSGIVLAPEFIGELPQLLNLVINEHGNPPDNLVDFMIKFVTVGLIGVAGLMMDQRAKERDNRAQFLHSRNNLNPQP